MYQKTRAWIELNMENLAYNVEQMKSRLPGNCRLMPAVKANAYGHGMIPVAKALNKLGIRDFCVAAAKEGAELRKAGIEGEILVLGYTHPEAFPLLLKYDLTQTVVDASYARLLAGYGKSLKYISAWIPVCGGLASGASTSHPSSLSGNTKTLPSLAYIPTYAWRTAFPRWISSLP